MSVCRTVSCDSSSITSNSTICSASSRSVQRFLPAGGLEQANAISFASVQLARVNAFAAGGDLRSNLSALLAVLLSLSAASAPTPPATPSLQGLGDLPAGLVSVAFGASTDVSVIAGNTHPTFTPTFEGYEAFR